MQDRFRTKEQLLNELTELRRRIAELEKSQTDLERRLAQKEIHQLDIGLEGRVIEHTQQLEKVFLDETVAKLFGKSEQKISSILAGITDCHYELDRDWRVVRINDQALAYFGREKEECIGQLLQDLFPTINDSFFEENCRKALSENISVHFDTHSVVFSDTWVEIHLYPTEEGGLLVFFRDISEHKRTEEAERQSQEHLRFALETIHAGSWSLDLVDHRAVFRSLEHDQILGYAQMLPEWTYEMFLEHVVPEERAIVDSKFRRAKENQDDWNFQCRIRRADGEVRWIWAAGRHTQNAVGNQRCMAGIIQDITDFKQMEEDLRRSRDDLELRIQERTAQFRRQADLLDLAHDAIIVSDIEGRIIFWNTGAENCYGFTKEESIGKVVHTLLRAKFPIPVKNIMDIVKREGRWEGELVHASKKGKEVITHSRWAMRYDMNGKPEEIMEINRDITLRKQAEEAIRMIGAYNRSLIEASIDPIVTIDPQGRISDVNNATEHVTGYTREKLIGTDFSGYFTDHEKAEVGYQMVFKEGTVRDYELEIRHRDGHVTPVLYNASVYSDEKGRIRGVLAAARDVSETKRMEKALRESEERYRMVIESASDGIALVKGDRHIYVNARFAEIFGYDDPGDIIGKTFSLVVHPDDLALVSGINAMRQAGESAPSRYEFKGIKKDGTIRNIWVSATRVNYQGEPVSLAYLRDITEYKNLEEQLRQSQKMEAIGALAGGIAHDFNNILAAIIGFGQMIEEDIPLGKANIQHVQRVLNAAFRGRELVQQILTFSRKTEFARHPVSLYSLAKETIQLLRASLPTTIEIILDNAAAVDTILAIPIEVQQVLLNLATNAALSMQESGGILHISLSDIELHADSPSLETGMTPGAYLQLMIKDTGIGMKPEVMERIFEPFFTTREVGKGTGLGLAVVYGIVKSLHGSIRVESTWSAGSTFLVYLPAVTAIPDAKEFPTELIHGNGERVLFIDDEELLVKWGQALLDRLGYEVRAMNNSTEALEVFSSDPSRFDLVITDQTMPGITGLQLAQEFLTIRPDIPVILCTGHNDTITPEKVREIGVKEFLMKPLAKDELAEAIHRALNKEKEQ